VASGKSPTPSLTGTAFTYQGRLNDGGSPASGIYDLQFAVYDALAGGNPVGGLLTNAATPVSNGVFTATLGFGGIFTGTNYWLGLAPVGRESHRHPRREPVGSQYRPG